MYKKTMVFGVLYATSFFGFAQQQTDSTTIEQLDEVIITDSRFTLNREKSGKVITKISQQELQNLQGKSVAEIINTTVGVEINGAKSNPGQNLSYYVRGGRNRQILILIDGIALTDASQISNDYDLRFLNVNQVESIEIMKGASSSLYGSGAASAVINITLKDAQKKPFEMNIMSRVATINTQNDKHFDIKDFNSSIAFNGRINKFNYLLSFGNQYTNGFSAITQGDEADAFNAYNGLVKLGYDFTEKFKFKAYANLDKFKTDFDDAATFSDADNQSVSKQYRVGLSPKYHYKNGNVTLNAAYNHISRNISSGYPADYSSNSLIADLFNRYSFSDTFYALIGINVQEHDMESYVIPFGGNNLQQSINPEQASFTIFDPYFNMVYVTDFGLNINTGARLNNHNVYGSHFVYNVNPSFRKLFHFGYVKVLASYSTAYITPSLYQLYEPSYGNVNLLPEENRTIEGGFEIKLNKKLTGSLVYFNRRESNFIDFLDMGNYTYQYANVTDTFLASGLEFLANYSIFTNLNLNVNFTYTQVEEQFNLRIPKYKGNARLNYQFKDHTFLSLVYQYTSDRNDTYFDNLDFTTRQVKLNSYSLWDLYFSHNLIKNNLKVFININNIFNTRYFELYNYNTKGRNISLGFNLTI